MYKGWTAGSAATVSWWTYNAYDLVIVLAHALDALIRDPARDVFDSTQLLSEIRNTQVQSVTGGTILFNETTGEVLCACVRACVHIRLHTHGLNPNVSGQYVAQ